MPHLYLTCAFDPESSDKQNPASAGTKGRSSDLLHFFAAFPPIFWAVAIQVAKKH